MISDELFLSLVNDCLNRNLRSLENSAQLEAISHSNRSALKIVAGPGSGKTTVLVLRALRFVLVDDVLPEQIVITTFTRKAAKELRTRWLDWGTALLTALSADLELGHVDLNRCRIDTLDSIAQQALTENRLPGTLAPVVAEESASKLLLKRAAFQSIYSSNQDVIDPLLSRYTFEGTIPRNRGEALGITKRLIERLVQDRVDLIRYGQIGQAQALVVQMLETYRQRLITTNVLGIRKRLLIYGSAALGSAKFQQSFADTQCI